MKRGTKSGHGTLLVLVLALLMLLAVMGVAHGFFSSSVVKQNQYATKGDVAIDLAANALTEAHQLIAKNINLPSSKHFSLFRKNLGSFTFSVPLSALPVFFAELKEQKCFSLVADEVKVNVLGQVSTSKMLPTEWDRAGRIRLSASIIHKKSHVTRRLAHIYDFRISLPALARPLDQHTLVIGDGRPLVTTYANANETINGTYKRLAELKEVLNERKKDLENGVNELAANEEKKAALPTLQLAKDECQRLLDDWPVLKEVKPFPRVPFTMTCQDEEIALAAIDLPSKIRRRDGLIKSLEKRQSDSYQSLCQKLQLCANGKEEADSVLKALELWCKELKALAGEYEALLHDDYLAFQRSFAISIKEDEALFDCIFSSWSPDDLIYKSTAVLYDGDVHKNGDLRSLNTKFHHLINRGPAFSGVLYVMNKHEELRINSTFKGQLLLVVEGDCVVERALVADKARDIITIISLGRLAVEGKMEGAIAAKGTLLIDSAASITGTLVITRPDFKNLPSGNVFAGNLKRDERLLTGPQEADGRLGTVKVHRLYATLGPFPVGVEAVRR